LPFGMVQIGPDTEADQYSDSAHTIVDFSLTHFSGTGCNGRGDIPFLPILGAPTSSPATNWTCVAGGCKTNAFTPGFSHANEQAAPGSYSVTLATGIKVELSATTRTGFAKMTFPSASQAAVLVNASRNLSRDGGGSIQLVGDHALTGTVSAGGACSAELAYSLYYAIEFDTPFTASGTWQGSTLSSGSQSASGHQSGAYVVFDAKVVQMKIGLSYTSLANAKQSLSTESPGWDIGAVESAADAAWNAALGHVEVSGGAADDEKKLYSALYRALYSPNLNSDLDGSYLGFDNVVHQADAGRNVYQNYSSWDIYRSWIQLVAMVAPQTSDIVQSLVFDGEQAKNMPTWSDANTDTMYMPGDPDPPMVASAYAFGARNFDTASALNLMSLSATNSSRSNRSTLENTQHYCEGDVSCTLDYATADFATSQMAQALGDTAKYTTFSARGQYWKNTFNSATGYFQPRNADGTWASPFSPTQTDGYTEGTAAQYVWNVPYNLQGLFTQMGGVPAAIPRLDTFFTQLNSGFTGQYLYIGNEPSFGYPWLYNSVLEPWKSQKVVRQIITQLFTAAGDPGLPGNDDAGALSSWLVWAYLGMYPMIPGTDILVLHGPLFPATTLSLANGCTVHINGNGAGPGAPYVQDLRINGVPTTHSWLHFADIAGGATLDFTMGATPNMSWGSSAADAPPSFDVGVGPAPPVFPTGCESSGGSGGGSGSSGASSGGASTGASGGASSGGASSSGSGSSGSGGTLSTASGGGSSLAPNGSSSACACRMGDAGREPGPAAVAFGWFFVWGVRRSRRSRRAGHDNHPAG